ncbi:hypothetical protein GUJ93_ZPchr0013g36063 [Zizania palustris]|uniref:Uncharacterized protein n=1 Tax=Zizania palustris TaxID=103762 RepID=A0A8J5WZJ6_ZIZPA|nr:hypothetical protein GUJ93_ZPchr0013g36063 [Zizania palustris]
MRIEANITSLASPDIQLNDSIADHVVHARGDDLDVPEEDDDFRKRLEGFIEQFNLELPQALLPTPPKVQQGNKNKLPSVSGRRSARLAAKNPEGKGPSSLGLQVLAKKLRVIADTPESTSQKLGALFKQDLTPTAVRAIRELVKLGGGHAMLSRTVGSHGASTSAQ